MKDSLIKLLDLQEIDKEINALMQSQKNFPGEIQKLKGELEAARQYLHDKQARSEELEKARRTQERDLEAFNEDLKKHQDRLCEVKTNREYDALQHEIEALQTRIAEHETSILETIEAGEELTSKLSEDEALYQEVEKERQDRIEDLTGKLGSVDEDVRGREEKRSVIETQIEKRPLSIYNRIRRMVRDGIAIVPIRKVACGGCFRQLSPQRLVEVRRGDSVIRCENCGRMLVWNEEATE